MGTIHASAVLRVREPAEREAELSGPVADLHLGRRPAGLEVPSPPVPGKPVGGSGPGESGDHLRLAQVVMAGGDLIAAVGDKALRYRQRKDVHDRPRRAAVHDGTGREGQECARAGVR